MDKIVEDAKKYMATKAIGQEQREEQKMEMDSIDEEMLCNVAEKIEDTTKQRKEKLQMCIQ